MKCKKYYGFSLIEVLIAISIVALIAVVSLPLFTLGSKSIILSQKKSESLLKLESELESVNAQTKVIGQKTINIGDEEVTLIIYEANDPDNPDVSLIYFEYSN